MMEENRVLALKYRPNRFEDLVGQNTISQTLSLALDSKRLSHAYLFSGLRGSGKTSTARIMAKALLCEEGPTSKPCEVCSNCLSANGNKHLDIIEMDAASNRGIDDIKDLIEHTKYKPSSARFKVFIIDEVHMLTTQAFNALLKTLEEPPGFVKFILATTDPLKLPATILSRTQHFRFKKISNKDVVHHLSYILNKESIEFDTIALEMITRAGQGSLRDTLTLLDQAIIFAKGKVDITSVTDMLGLIDPEFMDNMFDKLLQKGDIKNIVEELESYEASQVCDEMILYLKDKMLNKDPKFDTLLFDRYFRILSDAKHLLSINADSSFVLILTFSKLIEATNLKTIDELIKEVEQVPTTNATVVTAQKQEVVQSSTESIQEEKPKKNLKYHDGYVPFENMIASTQKEEVIEEVVTKIEEEVAIQTPSVDIPLENVNSHFEEEVIPTVAPIESFEQKPQENPYEVLYKDLVAKVYERSYELGECFENNFLYEKFENAKLTIKSFAEGEAKKLLWKNFAIIRHFIESVYGVGTEIDFIKAQREPSTPEPKKKVVEEPKAEIKEEIKTEDDSVGAGCVADMTKTANPKPSQKDLPIEQVLNSNFVKKTIEVFGITKVNVKSKI